MSSVPVSGVVPIDQMASDDEEDAELLEQSLQEANSYVAALESCRGVRERYVGLAIAGVVSVFLFHVDAVAGDEWLWVVAGDLPTTAFAATCAPEPIAALEHYCGVLDGWIETIRRAQDDSTPMAPSGALTAEQAVAIEQRVAFLRTEILPNFAGPTAHGHA
jgi:hypothetical protein